MKSKKIFKFKFKFKFKSTALVLCVLMMLPIIFSCAIKIEDTKTGGEISSEDANVSGDITEYSTEDTSENNNASQSESETETEWKQYLVSFLTDNFPSLFDKATVDKNDELLKKWYENRDFTPNISEIPVDASGEWGDSGPYFPIILPYGCEILDIDGDNIPEVIISYPSSYAEGHFDYIYKLNGTNYEELKHEENPEIKFYKNAQNKLVAGTGFYIGEAGYLAEIKDGKIILSDYVDSKGNVYSDGLQIQPEIEPGTEDEIKNLIPVPRFDFKDDFLVIDGKLWGCGRGDIKIPDGVTSVGYLLFNGDGTITSVTIPDSMTSIEEYTFQNCINLKSVTIPDSVAFIDDYAFADCPNLKISCSSGSYAQEYCIEKGVVYEIK